jgi:enamine deaminase RidA (YjgF/YER057c/UK114 family)
MRIDHPYSLLARANRHAWSCGQCSLSDDGSVLAPDDLARQADHVDDYIQRILGKAELSRANVGKLVLYHSTPDAAGIESMLSRFRAACPDAILLPVGIPFFYYAGMQLEVDVHAAETRAPLVAVHDEQRLLRVQAVDAGELIWVSLEVLSQSDAPQQSTLRWPGAAVVRDLLNGAAGVSPGMLLADHWFVGSGAARPALEYFREADLVSDFGAALGVTLPPGIVAMAELTFARNGDAPTLAVRSSSGAMVSARSSGSHFWIAARSVSPAVSVVGETKAIMAAVEETMRVRGWRFEDVCKATTHYVGSSAAEDLHDNMAVRNAYYRRPGPASTGVPVAAFPFSSSKIAVDVLGVI